MSILEKLIVLRGEECGAGTKQVTISQELIFIKKQKDSCELSFTLQFFFTYPH
jgi:hypothetical protein